MSPRGKKRPPGEKARLIRTTLELPHDLWQAIKRKAAEDVSDLRAITIAALEAYLGFKRKPEQTTRAPRRQKGEGPARATGHGPSKQGHRSRLRPRTEATCLH